VRHLHRCRDLPDPTLEAWELNIELNETPAMRDVIGRGQLDSMLASLECTSEELRSRCLLTLAFDELLSAGELAELNVEDFTPGNAETNGALVYRSVYGGAKKHHPVTDRSSEAICAWLSAARLKSGPLFPPMRRRGMSGNATEHTLRRELRRIGELARLTLNVRALHRGRSIELSGPDSKAERNSERSRRMYLLFECRWRDEPSAMFQMTQQRAAEREQERGFAWQE
jgi:integrase